MDDEAVKLPSVLARGMRGILPVIAGIFPRFVRRGAGRGSWKLRSYTGSGRYVLGFLKFHA